MNNEHKHKIIQLICIVFVLYTVGFIGYRLGYEQNPCSGLEIILSYPQENLWTDPDKKAVEKMIEQEKQLPKAVS